MKAFRIALQLFGILQPDLFLHLVVALDDQDLRPPEKGFLPRQDIRRLIEEFLHQIILAGSACIDGNAERPDLFGFAVFIFLDQGDISEQLQPELIITVIKGIRIDLCFLMQRSKAFQEMPIAFTPFLDKGQCAQEAAVFIRRFTAGGFHLDFDPVGFLFPFIFEFLRQTRDLMVIRLRSIFRLLSFLRLRRFVSVLARRWLRVLIVLPAGILIFLILQACPKAVVILCKFIPHPAVFVKARRMLAEVLVEPLCCQHSELPVQPFIDLAAVIRMGRLHCAVFHRIQNGLRRDIRTEIKELGVFILRAAEHMPEYAVQKHMDIEAVQVSRPCQPELHQVFGIEADGYSIRAHRPGGQIHGIGKRVQCASHETHGQKQLRSRSVQYSAAKILQVLFVAHFSEIKFV